MIAAALLTSLAVPAFAMDMMKCDEPSMMKAEEHAKMMKGDSMTMAMQEVDMAKTAMKDGKTDDCSMHLDKAMKQM
jgi:hypothetical protein